MEAFLGGAPRRTDAICSASVEICESRYDRVLLSVVDTPGLDFHDGHELRLDRQVSSIVRYIDAQYADTLKEVSGRRARVWRSVLRRVAGVADEIDIDRNRRSSAKARATSTFICRSGQITETARLIPC